MRLLLCLNQNLLLCSVATLLTSFTIWTSYVLLILIQVTFNLTSAYRLWGHPHLLAQCVIWSHITEAFSPEQAKWKETPRCRLPVTCGTEQALFFFCSRMSVLHWKEKKWCWKMVWGCEYINHNYVTIFVLWMQKPWGKKLKKHSCSKMKQVQLGASTGV